MRFAAELKWTKAALAVVATLVTLVALSWAYGATLPEGHVAVAEATFDASPQAVWSTISAFGSTPEWRSGLESVETLPSAGGADRIREHGADGPMTFRVEAFEPPRRMVLRIADAGLPFGGAWTYEVEPAGGGTRLRITEEGEVYNPIFRLVSRHLIGYTATLEQYLRDLGARLGEPDPRIETRVRDV